MGNLDRNHDIVGACDVLIAAPRQPKEIRRSGTWATVRYADQFGRVIALVVPDGEVQSA
jgi:predicted Rossmann fold nucleotide-binding protein DprA/Smf involved in DNA uptake